MAIVSLEKDSTGQPRFPGCSNIRDFEFIGKLGEGTFGSDCTHMDRRSRKLTDW